MMYCNTCSAELTPPTPTMGRSKLAAISRTMRKVIGMSPVPLVCAGSYDDWLFELETAKIGGQIDSHNVPYLTINSVFSP